jgi:predicted Zn-dependent protease
VSSAVRLRTLITGCVLAAFSAAAGAQFNLNLNRLIDTVKSVGQATTEITEQQEAQIGKEYAALLVGAAPLFDNADVQRYVNRVGRWLSLNAERPDLNWRFGVLDSDNINAFATPGGYVFVTKGLLARLRSEAELAGVLAHEITHVVRKHHLTALRKGAGMQAGANILAEFAAQRGSNQAVSERLISGVKEVMLRGLDKDEEFEADRMGVVIAGRAGYDPYGLPAVLQMLQAMNPQDSGLALLFATHPAPDARLDTLERVMGARLDRFAAQPAVTERFARMMLGPQAGAAAAEPR